jgi:hypothetical protein
MRQKQQQTKTTKHTIEFSNNTPARPRKLTRGFWPLVGSADGQETHRSGTSLLDAVALSGLAASRRRVNKLREGKLGVKWPDGACLSTRSLSRAPRCVSSDSRLNTAVEEVIPARRQPTKIKAVRPRRIIQRARRRQYSACHGAAPASGRTRSPTAAAPTPRSRSGRC